MDSSRAFRSRDQLLELVHWVRDTPAAREQHWLEWKSRIELGEKRWQARIAKFILGVSNRPRRIWEQAADGCAYILLGVEVGQLHNTALPDPAVFDKGVNLYLGANGPRWTAVAFNADPGIQVVVIVVEPPEPGRRPYIAKATFSPEASPVVNGRTYIRRAAETTEASWEEVEEMLRERDAHVRDAGPAWALRLEVLESSALIVVDVAPPTVQLWLDQERQALVGSMLPRSNPLNAFLNSADGRTREQFHQQVEAFLNAAGQRIEAEILWEFANAGLSEVRLVAHNDGDDNLLDLEVELVLPNDADAVGSRSDIPRHERLPERPRAFGTNLLAGPQLFGEIGHLNPRVPSGVVTRRSDGEPQGGGAAQEQGGASLGHDPVAAHGGPD